MNKKTLYQLKTGAHTAAGVLAIFLALMFEEYDTVIAILTAAAGAINIGIAAARDVYHRPRYEWPYPFIPIFHPDDTETMNSQPTTWRPDDD